MRFSCDDLVHYNVVRASFTNSHSQVEVKFAALQTSMGTVVNRWGKLDATDKSKTGRRYSAADEEHERQAFADESSDDTDASSDNSSDGRMDERPEDSETVLVGVAGGPRSSSSGQLPQIQSPQQPSQ